MSDPALPPLPALNSEQYLGDGLYVSFDGWNVWLRAPREEGDHRVALEPPVLQSFAAWAAPLMAHLKAR